MTEFMSARGNHHIVGCKTMLNIDKDEWAKVGQGNWRAFRHVGFDLSRVERASQRWAEALHGITRPWLCWNVDEEWCLVQQKLVKSVGWTPIVGFDPRVGPPKRTVETAVVVNFNEGLELPILYPHFPMEFVFRFCDKLAFWHSDLLIRQNLMRRLAAQFDAIPDGETIATYENQGLRHAFTKSRKRYWELVGCTTRSASLSQFKSGCGWWMNFKDHPNCPNEKERLREVPISGITEPAFITGTRNVPAAQRFFAIKIFMKDISPRSGTRTISAIFPLIPRIRNA
jgi:hypothetical protein